MDKEPITRSSFLNKVWVALGLVAGAEMVAGTVAWFRPRKDNTSGEQLESVFDAGPVDQFERGSVNAYVQGRFYLVRLEDGGFLALSRTCTHLSCTVPWVEDENRFMCPCHSSVFDIKGDVIDPPAPRAMDLFDVRIEGGIVRVDTSKRTKRLAFAPGQATYAETV